MGTLTLISLIYDDGYMVNKAREKTPTEKLLQAGEDLRAENPVLWAIVRGRGGVGRIGILSGQPKGVVLAELERLKTTGIIYVSERFEQPVYMLNPKNDGFGYLKRIRALYHAMELRWVEHSEIDLHKEKGLVSSAVFKEWKEAHPQASSSTRGERYDDLLTMKQAGVLVAVGMGWADRSTFKPIELARAQGYTQGGYAKQSLLALESKKLVQAAGDKHFRLTQLGVEKVRELQNAGIKASRRQEAAPIDTSLL